MFDEAMKTIELILNGEPAGSDDQALQGVFESSITTSSRNDGVDEFAAESQSEV